MEYRYHAQRFCRLPYDGRVGTINVGAILYLQDGVRWEPWRVEAWIPREIAIRNPIDKAASLKAVCGRALGLGPVAARFTTHGAVADWVLLACADAGLAW
jgi:hypothetical protein